MSLLSSIGKVITAPITLPFELAKAVAPAAGSVLKLVAGSFFEAGKMAAGAMSMMGMPMMNPMMAIGGQLLGQGLNGMQGLTFGAIDSLTSMISGRPVPFSNYPQQMYTPTMWDRAAMPGGFGGQYGSGAIYGALQNMGVPYPMGGPQAGGQYGNPYATQYNSSAATSAATTANAGGFVTGNQSFDLANAITNAPTYSPTEQKLLDSIEDPQQRAMQALQMRMQKQALLATMLSNLANMRHEMLKAVANNLRG